MAAVLVPVGCGAASLGNLAMKEFFVLSALLYAGIMALILLPEPRPEFSYGLAIVLGIWGGYNLDKC